MQDIFFCVASFLVAEHHNGVPIEACDAADQCTIIAKAPVAAQFHKIVAQGTNIIEGMWALRVARNLHNVPGH
jgi:hypothetical protein